MNLEARDLSAFGAGDAGDDDDTYSRRRALGIIRCIPADCVEAAAAVSTLAIQASALWVH